MPRKDIVRSRRDTAANWTAVNPTLLLAEFGYETDTGKLKMGDGSSSWSSLAYVAGLNGADGADGAPGADGADGSDAESGHLVEGRLTLTSNTPVTTSDVTGAGTLYFTPYYGNRVRIYDGTDWVVHEFTERSLSLTVTSGKNYDVFIYDNAGTLTLELSAAWTDDTTRADALALQDGVYVKSGATTRLQLGTIRASGTNTTEDSDSKRFVCNEYNRVERKMSVSDSGDSTYSTGSWRYYLADSANKFEWVLSSARQGFFQCDAQQRDDAISSLFLGGPSGSAVVSSINNQASAIIRIPSVGSALVDAGYDEAAMVEFGSSGADWFSMSAFGAIPM